MEFAVPEEVLDLVVGFSTILGVLGFDFSLYLFTGNLIDLGIFVDLTF